MKSFPSILKVNSIASSQRRPSIKRLVSTPQKTSRKLRLPCFAQQGDLYEVLGVDRSASTKEIKSAFKRKALKLHPDVNKAPDATEKFKAVRHAYQVLVNEDTRAQHDRKLRTGSSPFWSDFGQSSRSRGASGYSPKPAYGLDDVFRDLGEVFADFSQNRGNQEETIGSLWEELGNLGEEFVEFLEQEAGISPRDGYEPPAPDSDSKKTTSSPPPPMDEGMNSEDIIDEALKELKKQMGL